MGKKALNIAIWGLAIYGVIQGFKDAKAWYTAKKAVVPAAPTK